MGNAFKEPLSHDYRAHLALIQRIQETCIRYQISSLNQQIEACFNLFDQSQPINIVILGQFKAGKSSFLNTLIGKPVLPVGVIPVTTVITRLRFGREEGATVHFKGGRIRKVPVDGIGEFTSESRNPSNEKNVEVVDVDLPALGKYEGLQLVDTPGLGSVFQIHRETAGKWFPKVEAALVAISAERPLAESDIRLIGDLMLHTPRVIILLTKVDLLSPDQQEEVIGFFVRTLFREFQRSFPIFPFSTRRETMRWTQRLEDELFSPLVGDQQMEREQILRHKIQSIRHQCLNYLGIALKASAQADLDRENLRRLILDEKVNYDSMAAILTHIARENAEQTRSRVTEHLEKSQVPSLLKKKLRESLAEQIPTWKGNLWKLTRRYEAWVQEALGKELKGLSGEYSHFLGTLRKAHTGLSRSLEIFQSLLSRNVEKVLRIKLGPVDWKIDLKQPTQPDIQTRRTFDFHLDLFWFLIPMFIFRPFFERHFLKQIAAEVEVNLSRFAAQWEERINKTIDGMKKQAIQYVERELSTIESLLSQAQGRTDEIRQAMEELDSKKENLRLKCERLQEEYEKAKSRITSPDTNA